MFDDQITTCNMCSLQGNGCPGEGPINFGTPFIIGMNPGLDEVRDKRPFVGASSRIRDLLQGDYYWTNVVKCAGRVSRCASCRFIGLEINTIKPLKLVLLGGEAVKRMTGHPFRSGIYNVPTLYGWIQAYATWHPSPANNYNWERLKRACKEIQQWLKS